MWNTCSFFLLVLTLAPYQLETTRHQEKHPQQTITSRPAVSPDESKENDGATVGNRVAEPQHTSVSGSAKVTPQPRRDAADWIAYGGNLLLCVVGIGGIVVALQSLRIVRRQTVAAETAANVASASAQAYQTAERAWMSVRRVDTEDLVNARVGGSKPFNGKAFIFIWENIGRTPALNCSIVTMMQITDGGVPSFKPVSDTEQRTATLPVSVEVRGKAAFFTEEDIQSMSAKKTRIFLYSRAEYKLVYPTHICPSTEFCMEVSYGGFNTKKNEHRFLFSVIGPQNVAS